MEQTSNTVALATVSSVFSSYGRSAHAYEQLMHTPKKKKKKKKKKMIARRTLWVYCTVTFLKSSHTCIIDV